MNSNLMDHTKEEELTSKVNENVKETYFYVLLVKRADAVEFTEL